MMMTSKIAMDSSHDLVVEEVAAGAEWVVGEEVAGGALP